MTALDTLVVTTALSTIRRDLGASVEQLEWTVNAYNLSFAVLLMTAAALGDRFGRRRLFAAGIGLFVARLGRLRAGAVGRRADRGARGAGRRRGAGHDAGAGAGRRRLPAGAPRRGARDLLRRQRPRRRRRPAGRRRGHPGDRLAVDLLAQRADRARADPAGAGAHPGEPRPGRGGRPARARRWSAAGCSASSGRWCAATPRAGRAPRCSARSSAASACWPPSSRFELRAAAPMLPMRFFRSRAFSAGNAAIFCAVGSLFCAVFFMSQFLQAGLGYGRSAPACGCCRGRRPCSSSRRWPASSSTASASGRSSSPGRCCRRSGWRWIALIADAGMSYAQLIAPLMVAGVGISMSFPAAQNSVVGVGAARRRSARRRAPTARCASSAACSASPSASPPSPAPAATPRRPSSATASSPRWASPAGLSLLAAMAGAALPSQERRRAHLILPAPEGGR